MIQQNDAEDSAPTAASNVLRIREWEQERVDEWLKTHQGHLGQIIEVKLAAPSLEWKEPRKILLRHYHCRECNDDLKLTLEV